MGTGIISYELVVALNEGEQEQSAAIGGVQTTNNNYKTDSLYNPFPYQIFIHKNVFENDHWFPDLGHDIGKLFMMKSFMSPPDIAYDGIADPERSDAQICAQENGEIVTMYLDAAHDFEALSKDLKKFDCEIKSVTP